jgi:hypothetical protein
LKHALAEISKEYVDGCVAFYDKQNPNPWQSEYDALEAMIKMGSEVDIKNAIDVFETNCKALIKRYKR